MIEILIIIFLLLVVYLIYQKLNSKIGRQESQSFIFLKVSSKIPLNLKSFLKKIFFPQKYFEYEYEKKFLEKIKEVEQKYGYSIDKKKFTENNLIVKTDGTNSFRLEYEDNLYFYKHKFKIKKIKLIVYLKDEKKIINLNLEKNEKYINYFQENLIIESKYFFKNFSKAIYFRIDIDDLFSCYFAINNRDIIKKSKNLLIFPVTNFFNYNSNLLEINKYSSTEYLANFNEVPLTTDNTWNGIDIEKEFYRSILNQFSLFNDMDIINDFQISDVDITNYENIIFPLHQEYISENALEKVIKTINENEINVISIGGANFLNKIEFIIKKNGLIAMKYFQNGNEKIDYKKYNLNTYNWEDFKFCVYKSKENFLKNIKFSCENMDYRYNKNSESFFFNIHSSTGKTLPVFTITKYKKGKIIQLNSDFVATRFVHSNELKEFFINSCKF